MKKILTISVAAYNAALDLDRCLTSMLGSNVADLLEIIVVNDGSKDNTLEVAQKYADQYPDIVRVVNKENGGHGSTINASIRLATGKYFKIVDSDDWVDKRGIEQLVAALSAAEADLILNPYHSVDAHTLAVSATVNPFPDNQVIGKELPIEQAQDLMIFMHSATFRMDIIQKMGPVISENCFYVDMEYTFFPMPHVRTYLCLDFPVYHYLLGTATQSMNMKNMIKRKDQHLHVTRRVVSFYCEHKQALPEAIRKILLRRLHFAVLTQYVLYFNTNSREAKPEITAFDQWLKGMDAEVYACMSRSFMKFIALNRHTNFIFYRPLADILKTLHFDPKL